MIHPVIDHILEFARLQGKVRFHMTELTNFITDKMAVAPDTPARILRNMRQAGKINYNLVDRSSSLYEFV